MNLIVSVLVFNVSSGVFHFRDIAELTQQVNHLDNELNEISELNEALRERCGLGEEESVDVGPLRARRSAELEQLRRDKQALEQQVCATRCLCN